MTRVLRLTLGLLMIGASLLPPVLLRGQGPSQPWAAPQPTPAPTQPPVVIAATHGPPPVAPGTAVPRTFPLVDDGLRPPQLTPPPPGPVARGVEVAPLRPVAHEVRSPHLEPSPLSPSVTAAMRVVHLRPQAPGAVASSATVPLATPTPQPTGPLAGVSNAVLSVDLHGHGQVVLDDVMPVELVVRNQGRDVLGNVRVELPLPAGIRYVTAQPIPEVLNDRLVWAVGTLEVRGERRIRVDLMVKTPEEIALQPQATYATGTAYRPQVIRPAFAVQQLGPDAVPRGLTATLRIQLTNHSHRPLTRVVLTDNLPVGLHHAQGTQVRTDLGTLAPGESRTVNLDVLAHRSGRWLNEVVAEAEGGVRTTSRAALVVAEPSLTVRVQGPERVTVAEEVDFRIEVVNGRQGPAAQNIRLVQALPEGLELLQATSAGQVDPVNRRVVWQLGTLEPGQMQTVFVKTRCLAPGLWSSQATLTAAQLAPTTAECTVTGAGGCQLALTVAAREDHLEVNGETVYEARVKNVGNQTGRNVRLAAWLPEGVTPVRADGPPGLDGRVQQQQVFFDGKPALEPGGVLVYRLRVKGQRAGLWRLRVEALADQLARPLLDEVTVDVRPDPRANGR